MTTPLYERLVGEAWQRLPTVVRGAHLASAPVRARGAFRVTRGANRVARALATLLRLPPAGDRTPILLEITPHGAGEKWFRTFGRSRLTTRQYESGDGLLAERFGPVELCFRLVVDGDSLCYEQRRVRLCLGPLRVGVPRRLAPRVAARESAAAGARGTHVIVAVELPLVGLLIRYEGKLQLIAEPQ